MTTTKYAVNWDNGASACGTFPDRFATEEEAQACRQRLTERFPGSEDVWMVRRDIVMQEFGDGVD